MLLALCLAAPAQEPEPSTLDELVEAQAALEGTDSPDAEVYAQALELLRRAEADRATAGRFRGETAEVPAQTQVLRDDLAEPLEEPQLEPDGLSLMQVETQAAAAAAELDASRAAVRELDQDGQLRSSRLTELPSEIAAAQQAGEEARRALAALPGTADQEARRDLLAAQAEAGAARAEALQAELSLYEAQRELLPLRRDLAARRQARAERAAAFWQAEARKLREAENQRAADATDQRLDALVERFPALAPLAQTHRELNDLRSGSEGLPQRIAEARDGLEDMRRRLVATGDRFRAAMRRMAAGGLTEATAITLRRDYDWLPLEPVLRAQAEEREDELSQAQLQSIGLEEDRALLTDLPRAVEALLAEVGVEAPDDELRAAATELAKDIRQAQDDVLASLETLVAELFEQRRLGARLEGAVEDYRSFIEQHILWVRSSPLDPWPSLLAVPEHARRIAARLAGPAGASIRSTLAKRPGASLLLGLVLVTLLAGRRYLKRKREQMALAVRSYRTDHYLLTVRALVQTALLALPLPLAAWCLARLLAPSPDELVRAFAAGLAEIALVWFVLRFLRSLLADKSVGPAHFRWPSAGVAALRRELGWYEPCAVLLGLVASSLDRQSVVEWSDSVGRLCFVLWLLASTLLAHRLLRGERSFWHLTFETPRGLLGRTYGAWSAVLVFFPLGLAVMTALGYYYTAQRFQLHLRYSFLLALALLLVNALLLRWLFITRRRLAVSQALEERARRQKEIEASLSETGAPPAEAEKVDGDKVDIPAIDARTRELFRSSLTLASVLGLYLIWASALPALQGLDRVQILPRPAILPAEAEARPGELASSAQPAHESEPGSGSSSSTSSALAPALRPVVPPAAAPDEHPPAEQDSSLPARLTLADVLAAVLVLLLTSVAARNLPALLELALLQRLPLDGGSRYAVTTILRYVILIAGVSALSTALGIGWRDIQWLVAALTFGLAFGLQEIFANFVSGLIILLERPVRVGDIVTVGTTEGRVTQLRMRATTILDWDRRELLVPNKEFITTSVINWTLSDPITRIVVPVGIAYGSDTARARSLLLEAARADRMVLDDPEPSAIFKGFGDSTLDFELRVFIASRDLWPSVVDGLHTRIDDSFRAAGVEIAFPQRDLHIRSAEGLATLAPREPPG